ncbi:hypothetical protein E2C01_038325 [Portunus trituberculatus]|uniref:Uncharacterized protein n=1 Tax=Portunus trituberculatus TaxID=210409 RepID=A0A5B7FI91_PORTR|nr:hypothetical protein [Portunus trituberculatus]
MPQKFNSSIYQLDTTFQTTIPFFFSDTQLSPSPTLNILGLSFTHNLKWELHIASLATNNFYEAYSPVFLAPNY